MTIVIADDGGDNEAVEALTETVEELAETVEELATEPEPETVVVVESETDSHLTDIVLGTVVERLNRIEERLDSVAITADVALDVATTPDVVDEPESESESEPEPDVPPATWKTKFHKFWFGDT